MRDHWNHPKLGKMQKFRIGWAGVITLGMGSAMVLGASNIASSTQKPLKPVNFNRDIRPILSNSCFKCHGFDPEKVAAGLRLDVREDAIKDRRGYRAIVPGNPEQSLLMKRLRHPDIAERMPPPDSGTKAVTPEQVELFQRWIAEGAKYEPHWAFIPPKMPTIPQVADAKWAKSPIDKFVLAGLADAGLAPEPIANRETLIRRVSLTLTGILPSPKELTAFLSDRSSNAYEKMVDRYLAKPTYGEHQARYWLDAVRYGDTHGLHLDNERAIYPYRDWVVRAFNSDLPFDQFTTWQLAGDLLPSPTIEQKIATGYVRMNPTTSEGGAIEAEFLAKNTFDRVDTTSTVFLGMTVACARCHDHKFDPIRQKDYFGLFAYLNSTADAPLDGNALLPEPVMRAPDPAQAQELERLDKELTTATAKVDLKLAKDWLIAAIPPQPTFSGWEFSGPYKAADFDQAFAKQNAPEPEGKGDTLPWKSITLELGKPLEGLIAAENAAGYFRAKVTGKPGRYIARISSDDGVSVWVNSKQMHMNKVLRGVTQGEDSFKIDLNDGENTILIKVVNGGGADGVKLSIGDETSGKIDAVLAPARTDKPLSAEQAQAIKGLYLSLAKTKNSAQFVKLSTQREELLKQIPMTLVAKELPEPRKAFVLRRGEYNLPTDPVERTTPEALGPWPKDAPRNRLGLAEWLVNPQHPLTARVFANRIWQQHFGVGIVKTAEDFGNQGEWPSHPELLDYLAVTFQKSGWSVKKLHKAILMSNAFRQSSVVTSAKLEADPENRMISRGPRFRLDAEMIRDNALFVSGLLKQRIGGRGFKPYQPEGIWEAIAFTDSNTSKYSQDMDDSIYRRSLYLFWKRTSPHPIMMAFDAPMRETCVVRRSRTNTPLQALVTLNEPAFVEASRVMAEQLIAKPATDEVRIAIAFSAALSRKISGRESALLLTALARYRAEYNLEPAKAEKLIKVGLSKVNPTLDKREVAAWTLLCSTIMNTDEFLTQH